MHDAAIAEGPPNGLSTLPDRARFLLKDRFAGSHASMALGLRMTVGQLREVPNAGPAGPTEEASGRFLEGVAVVPDLNLDWARTGSGPHRKGDLTVPAVTPARLAALEARIAALEDALASAREDARQARQEAARAIDGLEDAAGLADGLRARLDLLESHVKVPRQARERDLSPSDTIRLADWVNLPGDHGRPFADAGIRKTAGTFLSNLYAMVNPDQESGLYRVADLRLFSDYLASLPEGERPSFAAWARFYRGSHGKAR